MQFLRYLRLIPEPLRAILLGMFLLPLRALAYTGTISLILLCISIMVIIPLSIFIIQRYVKENLPLLKILLFPVICLFTAAVITILCTVGIIAVIGITPFATIRSGLRGIRAGFNGGFPAMWNAFEDEPSFFENLYHRLDILLKGESGFTIKFFNELEEKDLPVNSHKSDDEELLLLARATKDKSALLSGYVPTEYIQCQLNSLQRYIELSRSLEEVRDALITNDLGLIEDGLIQYMDVTQPVLVEKQYLQDGTWHTVPVSSYVTDKNNLFKWFREKGVHPLTRDLIKNPAHYQKMRTRYRWHELNANACYSQELFEARQKTSELISELQKELANEVLLEQTSRSGSQLKLNSTIEFNQHRLRSSSVTSLSIFHPDAKKSDKEELGEVNRLKGCISS